MKTVLSLVAVLALSASVANAEDLSRSTLAKMGLSNIKVMSDAEGMQVRGKLAFAYSFGSTNAATLGASGSNSSGAAGIGFFVAGASNTSASAAQSAVGVSILGFPVLGVAHSAAAASNGSAAAFGF